MNKYSNCYKILYSLYIKLIQIEESSGLQCSLAVFRREGLFDVSVDIRAPHQRHRRANSTDPNPCQLQYLAGLRGENVYSRLTNSLMNLFCSLLVHTMISGHECVLFELFWHGCAWQFLTCVMSYVDTEMERKDTGLIGSSKVTAKLQESILTTLVLTPSPKASEHTLYILHVSVAVFYPNIICSDQIRLT